MSDLHSQTPGSAVQFCNGKKQYNGNLSRPVPGAIFNTTRKEWREKSCTQKSLTPYHKIPLKTATLSWTLPPPPAPPPYTAGLSVWYQQQPLLVKNPVNSKIWKTWCFSFLKSINPTSVSVACINDLPRVIWHCLEAKSDKIKAQLFLKLKIPS